MKASPIVVYLPDTRGVELSRYGSGNRKIGFGVFTYSRFAGKVTGTCPGSSQECEAICYAKRISGVVRDIYERNLGNDVPPIPAECQVLRIHISGDFNTPEYVQAWIARLKERPDVTCWAYTRSWRVPELLPHLEELRALPNVQLFASMDPTITELPPVGWRRAWIRRDVPHEGWPIEDRLSPHDDRVGKTVHNLTATVERMLVDTPALQGSTFERTPALVCPEETGRKSDCLACGYCFEGKRNDVVFLEHHGPAPQVE